MPKGPSLAITIVNHRQDDHLRRCLESLRRYPYTGGPTDILVLDNASMGTLRPLMVEFPEVVFIEQRKWRGFGANQNHAISLTDSDLVLVLNPDAQVRESAVDALAAALADPTVAVAGAIIDQPSGPIGLRAFPHPAADWGRVLRAFTRRRTHPDTSPAGLGQDTGWVSGAAIMFKRLAFSAVGGFDESIFMFSEEVDLQKRLVDGGYCISLVASATVDHLSSSSQLGVSAPKKDRAYRVELNRGMRSYAQKHHGWLGAVSVVVVLVLRSCRELAVQYMPVNGRRKRLSRETRLLARRRLSASLPPYRRGIRELAEAWNRAQGEPGPEDSASTCR